MSHNNQQLIAAANKAILEQQTRRHFFKECVTGMGAMAMGSLLGGCNWLGSKDQAGIGSLNTNPLMAQAPHFAPKAKSVIYLHMAGAPSQLELFDYKPDLQKLDGLDCPQSLLEGKKFALYQRGAQNDGATGQF